jgi:hypothetical protein
METRIGGFDPDEYRLGMRLREQFAFFPKLTAEQTASTLQMLSIREEEYIKYIQASPEEFRGELAGNKKEMINLNGKNPSRVNLTAEKILHGIYYPMHNTTLNAYLDPNIPKQISNSFYDYGSGVISIANEIFTAETDIEGLTDKIATDTVARMEEDGRYNLSVDQSAEIYLDQINNAQKASNLLVGDSSGFKLIENSVEEILQDAGRTAGERKFQRILYYQEPQLVLAGAEFAARAYKELYPLTQ